MFEIQEGFMIRFLEKYEQVLQQTALKWLELNLLKIKTEIFILTILIRIQTIIAMQRQKWEIWNVRSSEIPR